MAYLEIELAVTITVEIGKVFDAETGQTVNVQGISADEICDRCEAGEWFLENDVHELLKEAETVDSDISAFWSAE